jgi:hypothetical protein
VSREQIWRANAYFHGRTEGVLGERRVTDEQQRLKERKKKRKEKRAGLCQDLAGGRCIVLDVFQVTVSEGGQFWAMVTKSHEVLAGNDMDWHAMVCNRMALHNEPRLARPSGRKAGGHLVME